MSQQKLTAPYGSWPSPITSDIVSGAGKTLCGTAVGSLGRLLWLESRPTESGRSVLVKAKGGDDEATDITPKEFSVRILANEYGGGDFSVSGDTVFFSNYDDQRLYKQSIGSKGLNMYHPYAISIRVILELLIKFQAFIKYTSQSQSRSRPKCYTIELDWTRDLELMREFN
ncbi:putative bleomycin hydrolase [Helianthus debilis subsp. tardiflorus]